MKVVIAGAGFGGLRLARRLNNRPGFDVLLLDKYNYHQFQPLFYQVATAGLDASNISFPLRKVFQKSRNVRIRMAEIREIKPEQNTIVTDQESITYDVLVLATGADTNFFGNANVERYAFPMKSTTEALQLRYRILRNFEQALTVEDPDELQSLMNIVIVGAGPTGVELSGALAEMKHYVLPKDYPELDFSKMQIFLLEGTAKTLGAMSEQSAARSRKYLDKLGVMVKTNSLLKDYDGKTVALQDGTTIPSSTVIWAAGIKGNVPVGINTSLIARGNRIRVDEFCRVGVYNNNMYALGDLAYLEDATYPKGHPQVAPVAIQMADLIAANLKREVRGKMPVAFRYRDKGSMATVGRNLAVVDVPKPKLHLGGFIAWLTWMALHLMLILGVKNRFFVFSNWLYNYVTYDQNLRLIFREFDKPDKTGKS